jgi:hypothetical protein
MSDLQVYGASTFANSKGVNPIAATTSTEKQPYSLLRAHYKDITFDTLKERHDNFSFDKVVKAKFKVADTMHFEGMTTRPTNPDLIIFKK